jgi:UDP-N-acetylmuramoyl-L-alanyl-D-glutamate--2,6-diaminopimelate ligase
MELTKLMEGVEIKKMTGESRKEIKGVAYHSHQVRKGYLFAAIRGLKVDGHQYIEDALQRGAETVLLEEERKVPRGTAILVPNSRMALARIAANFYGNPSSRINLIGVTGTNGKTTITYLLESIFKKARHPAGVIGTINYHYGQTVVSAPNTTPESLDLQRILAEMVDEGITHVIMEVSSHGLDLDRIHGCQFDGAIFTNLTQDHLDFHPTMNHYFESKKKLFSDYLMKSPKARRFAVTNQDDPRGEAIVEGVDVPVFRYGLGPSCQISADQVTFTLEGLSCRVKTPGGLFPLQSQLIGGFNLHNIMAAVSTGVAMDIPLETMKDGIESMTGVSGRLERVENQKGIHVFVDYAHTPDALERSLMGLTSILEEKRRAWPQTEEKVITVFGCGGDRDRTKRPLMGEVAARLSDLVVLTSDNPRTEDPLAIVDEAEKGVQKTGLERWAPGELKAWRKKKGYCKVPDRREAIRTAVRLARPSDVVLIAGKGHEDYQIIGTKKFPFDDRVEVKRALEEL